MYVRQVICHPSKSLIPKDRRWEGAKLTGLKFQLFVLSAEKICFA